MEAGTRIAGSEARRRAILDAALACFTEHGYAATTIEQIRDRSGASIGSIYHHFGGKEGIAGALYADGLRRYQEGLLGVLRRHRDSERGIKAIVSHHLRWVAANRDLAWFLLGRRETEVALGGEAEIRELNRTTFGETAAWLRPHVEAGRIRELPFDLYYVTLIGPSQELARHWLAGRIEIPIKTAERVLGQAAWDALAAEGGTDA
jgi:AcrR family transcriptional regulator